MVQNYIAGTIVVFAIGYSLFAIVKKMSKKNRKKGNDCSSCEGCPLKDLKNDCNLK